MKLHRSKIMVGNWLMLSFVGVYASYASYFHGALDTIYGFPTVMAAAMLMWIRADASYYQQPFYRLSWWASMLALLLLLVPGALWFFKIQLLA